ncbi:Tetratricopeptide repeat protein SKI3 [Chlorella vulgaris]
MTDLQASLQAAEACLEAGQPKEALNHCKAALKADKQSVEALLLIGRAAHELGEWQQAELAYRKALDVQSSNLPAWAGLARLFAASGNIFGAVEANEKVLSLLPEEDPSHQQYELCLADAYNRCGRYAEAARQYRQLLAHEPEEGTEGQLTESRVELLCRLADIQLKLDEKRAVEEVEARLGGGDSGGNMPARSVSNIQLEVLSAHALEDEQVEARQCTTQTLLELCSIAPLAERYVKYHEEWLKRCLLRIFSAPPRSVERQHFRLAALRECHTCMWKASCSALPYEAAVWLLEEEEELKGGHVPVGGQVVGSSVGVAGGVMEGGEGHVGGGQQSVLYAFENFARRMVHQFPSNPTAQVCLGLMLRRRACHDGTRPVPQALRRQIEAVLRRVMEDDSRSDCGTGWKALAELQYENRHYPEAYDTAVRGLRWLHSRRERGHEALTHVALSLRLVAAKSLRRMGKLDEAETHFKVLAGWVTEGETAFGEMSGSSPVSIHQQALRGIALVALERGDRAAAMAQYERILGKAALGRGPAEHWAHADYGWLLYEEGDLQGARCHLEDALRVSTSSGCYVTDSQLAEHHYRLGEVYWKMRGRYRSEKQFAYTQFFDAASVEGHAQAPAFAALGRYFQEVEGKEEQALRCFKRALALDPSVAAAGDQLCAMLVASGKAATALSLCREIASRAPQARWAYRRCGYLLAASEEYEQAVTAFQTALKGDVKDAAAWEGLAASYQSLGRFTAALKAYTRALHLSPQRAYSHIQSGNIHMALGSFAEGTSHFEAALQAAPNHPAAQLGAAESLVAAAAAHARQGALGTAAAELARAAEHTLLCASMHGTLEAAWKLHGDVLVQHHAVTPSPHHPTISVGPASGNDTSRQDSKGPWLGGELDGWRRRVQAMRQARRAYGRALHLNPARSGAWQDAAFSYHLEWQLLRAHPAVASTDGTGPANLASLAAAAERCARAGLGLEPASADLWLALGMVAAEAAVREYALSRALQLNPKSVPAWVALARLYAEEGAAGPAASALQHARSHEPAVPGIWEAMAEVAALSSTGASEQAAFQEHAYGLGAGPGGLLGFAESGIHAGRARQGPVYAAARKAALMQPLNPAAHNILGLASEARGDFATAANAYKMSLQLLLGARDQAGSVLQPSAIPHTSTGLQTAVQLNLARALTGGGASLEAAQRYEELELAAELYDQPPAWLAYAAAKRCNGDVGGAVQAAGLAVGPGTPAQLLAAAVRAALQLKCEAGQPAQALEHLQQQLAMLRAGRVLLADMEELWVTVVAGAAAARDAPLLQQALSAARAWAVQVDDDSASFTARLCGLEAAGSLAVGGTVRAVVQYSQALHLCPTDASLSVSLAAAVLMLPAGSGTAGAAAALRLLQSPLVVEAAVAARDLPGVAPAGKALPEAALEAGSSALLTVEHPSQQQLSRHLSTVARGIHEAPANPRLWHFAALAAKQLAARSTDGTSDLRAQRWSRAAEVVTGRAAAVAAY